jgi:hypothetical protein
MANLIEAEPSLGRYALHFQYFLLNEKGYSRQQLLAIRNIVSTLFLAEAHYDIRLLEEELLNLYEREEDKQAVSPVGALRQGLARGLWQVGLCLSDEGGGADHVDDNTRRRTQAHLSGR